MSFMRLSRKLLSVKVILLSRLQKKPLKAACKIGWQKEEYVERKSAQLYCVLVNHRSEILEMKEQVQLIRSLLAA